MSCIVSWTVYSSKQDALDIRDRHGIDSVQCRSTYGGRATPIAPSCDNYSSTERSGTRFPVAFLSMTWLAADMYLRIA